MPRFRPDLDGLLTYVPGRPIEEVSREIGIDPDKIAKLASNESPEGPFPGVTEAVLAAAVDSNRYPDNDAFELGDELARRESVSREALWLGAGSTGLLGAVAYGVGGPGTSAVYAWPSFVMYRIISRWAMTESIEVGLDDRHAHDLEAMSSSLRHDTTIVYVCNPNNPSGTTVPGGDLETFIESIPDRTLVVVDEAYHHFVEDSTYRSAVPLALQTPNVIVLRTLSKVYALAGHRVGYAIGAPDTLEKLKRTQAPFTVSSLAQAAALASLPQEAELKRRIVANRDARQKMQAALDEKGVPYVPSQANFVFMRPGPPSGTVFEQLLSQGVIVRPMSRGWVRVTLGTPEENETFLNALDQVVSA